MAIGANLALVSRLTTSGGRPAPLCKHARIQLALTTLYPPHPNQINPDATPNQHTPTPATKTTQQVSAGCFIRAVNAALPPGDQLMGLRVMVGAVMVSSLGMFGAKAFIDSKVLGPMQRKEAAAEAAAEDAAAAAAAAANGGRAVKRVMAVKKKDKGSFAENFAVIMGSAKIRNLALVVMGYGVAHR
jgi:hypothetical protein